MIPWRAVCFTVVFGVSYAPAQEAVTLREVFPSGTQYHVSSRVELAGSMTLPPEKGQTVGKPLTVKGTSAIEYDEKVLTTSADGAVQKTARLYRRLDVHRTLGAQPQASVLRRDVSRLVLIREGSKEIPFSPDGPLLWSEIDLVRTDVFTPALTGFLPTHSVRPGDHWPATALAVAELTDMDRIDESTLECRFDDVSVLEGRRFARIGFSGSVRGTNEDGPTRQQLDGYFYFDLVAGRLSYLYVKGTHFLLDKDGKTVGTLEGKFTLTRQVDVRIPELSDERLAGVGLEPTETNSLLLYDNPDLGLKFLYPRRWRIVGISGRQITIDDAEGSGLLLTVEDLTGTPTGAQFQAESRDFLQKQKARILKSDPPRQLLTGAASLEQFAFDAELGGQRVLMDYFISRQALAGVTIAARLVTEDAPKRQVEVERLARSLQLSRKVRS